MQLRRLYFMKRNFDQSMFTWYWTLH